jgi:hypothetical protein
MGSVPGRGDNHESRISPLRESSVESLGNGSPMTGCRQSGLLSFQPTRGATVNRGPQPLPPEQKRTTIVPVKLNAAEREQVDLTATAEGRSRSDVIRRATFAKLALTSEQLAIIDKLSPSVKAALMRIGRRIDEGFQGEIQIAVHEKGIRTVSWKQVENGDQFGGGSAP